MFESIITENDTKDTINSFLLENNITENDIVNCEAKLRELNVQEIIFPNWNNEYFSLHIGFERIKAERILSINHIKVLAAIIKRTDVKYANEITGIDLISNGIYTCYPMIKLSFYKSLKEFFLELRQGTIKKHVVVGIG